MFTFIIIKTQFCNLLLQEALDSETQLFVAGSKMEVPGQFYQGTEHCIMELICKYCPLSYLYVSCTTNARIVRIAASTCCEEKLV